MLEKMILTNENLNKVFHIFLLFFFLVPETELWTGNQTKREKKCLNLMLIEWYLKFWFDFCVVSSSRFPVLSCVFFFLSFHLDSEYRRFVKIVVHNFHDLKVYVKVFRIFFCLHTLVGIYTLVDCIIITRCYENESMTPRTRNDSNVFMYRVLLMNVSLVFSSRSDNEPLIWNTWYIWFVRLWMRSNSKSTFKYHFFFLFERIKHGKILLYTYSLFLQIWDVYHWLYELSITDFGPFFLTHSHFSIRFWLLAPTVSTFHFLLFSFPISHVLNNNFFFPSNLQFSYPFWMWFSIFGTKLLLNIFFFSFSSVFFLPLI